MRYSRLDGTPYLTNCQNIQTIAHLKLFLSEFWPSTCSRAQQKTLFSIESGCGQRKSGRGFKKNRALCAHSFNWNPPLYKAKSATGAPHVVLKVVTIVDLSPFDFSVVHGRTV